MVGFACHGVETYGTLDALFTRACLGLVLGLGLGGQSCSMQLNVWIWVCRASQSCVGWEGRAAQCS
eukprot:350143-Chlamydomonas_euryale.AAC.2